MVDFESENPLIQDIFIMENNNGKFKHYRDPDFPYLPSLSPKRPIVVCSTDDLIYEHNEEGGEYYDLSETIIQSLNKPLIFEIFTLAKQKKLMNRSFKIP